MPVHTTRVNGKPAYQYGTSGTKYTYTAGDASSRARAKKKAEKQAVAIRMSQMRRGERVE